MIIELARRARNVWSDLDAESRNELRREFRNWGVMIREDGWFYNGQQIN